MVTEQDILNALKHVDDPDLHKDLVTLNMIKDIEIEGDNVSFSVYLTTPACPMKEMIENACRTAISHFVSPNLNLIINMTSHVTTTEKTKTLLPNIKNIILVGSGKGGVGKSTVAAGLAVSLSRMGADVGLLDADIYGPSLPTMFGIKDAEITVELNNGIEMMQPIVFNQLKLFSIGFLSKSDDAIVWRGPMLSKALKQFISGVNWGNLDYLIIDLPPGTGDVQITLTQSIPVTGALVVTTPQNMSIADAIRACQMFKMSAVNIPILGIVENMSYFSPTDMPDKKYFVFGDGGGEKLAEKFYTKLLGQLPLDTQLFSEIDNGMTLNSKHLKNFSDIAQQLARQIAINNAQTA